MEIRPKDAIKTGEIHSFTLSALDDVYPTTVDYISGQDIPLHISIRPLDRILVVNNFTQGCWQEEAVAPLPAKFSLGGTVIKVAFDADQITIEVADSVSLRFKRSDLLQQCDLISSSAEGEFSTSDGLNRASGHPAPVARPDRGHTVSSPSSRLPSKPEAPDQRSRPIVPRPDYVGKVLEEFRTVELQTVKTSARPMPDRLTPILISVVKDEIDRLHDFMRHYREAGIERFVFVDNGSTDGTMEFLQAQADVDLFLKPGKFDWMLKQGWISKVVSLYGYERWFLYLDADEHIVFDGFGEHTFRDVASLMEARGIRRVRGLLVDMYADGPLLSSTYEAHNRLDAAYPFLDQDTYREEVFKEIVSVKGGPRTRVFGRSDNKFRPELTKYPLFQLRDGEYMVNPHHFWPYDDNFLSKRVLAILHYKFLPGIINRIDRAIREKNYWDGSFEYQCYLDVIKENQDISLRDDRSVHFAGVADLVKLGIIAALDWPNALDAAARMRSAYRRRHAALDGADGLSGYGAHLAKAGAARAARAAG